MKEIAGIDIGQSTNHDTTGVCILDTSGKIVDTLLTRSLDDVVEFIKIHRCNSVYIDAPLSLPFDEKEGVYINRFAESCLMRRRNAYSVNPAFTPLSTNMLTGLGMRAITLKKRLLEETDVRRAFEVHPKTSLEYLSLPHYKEDLKKFIFKFSVVSGIDIRNMENEHLIDSVVCAYVGYLEKNNQCVLVGDINEGQILVPAPTNIRCVFFDMDGTLTHIKSPWQKIFEDYNIWQNGGDKLLAGYMNKEYDYKTFCEKDIKLWMENGITHEKMEKSLSEIPLNEYAIQTLKCLAQKDIKCIIISTGFYHTAKRLAEAAGLTFEQGFSNHSAGVLSVFANDVFEEKQWLKLKLDVHGDDSHKNGKGEIMKKCLKQLKIGPVRSLAVGDSLISDKEMFELAGDSLYIAEPRDILKLSGMVTVHYGVI